jgi:GxxExxY protein
VPEHGTANPKASDRITTRVAIVYHGLRLDVGYRIDMLVEDRVVVEIKAVESLPPIHRAQVLTISS